MTAHPPWWFLHRAGELVRQRGAKAAARALRLTSAAVIAYVVARALFPHTQPLTGPLTALLVVQVTLYQTLTTGLQRVLSVVSGVLVAVLFSSVVGLTWWSLGAVIAASIVIGQLLRLGEHLLEVPISAMLVLGVSSAETAATSRVAETLVGAAVGVLVNVLFPPPLRSRSAGEAVQRLAVDAGRLLDRVAEELPQGATTEQANEWLQDVRRLDRDVLRAERAVEEARDARRLNPRAMGTLNTEPILLSGLEALEHSAVALRAMFRSIAERVRDSGGSESAYDEDLRQAFAVLLQDLAESVRAFGSLVRAEAELGERSVEAKLADALEALREARARLTELLLVDPHHDAYLWQLNGSLLAAVARVLSELDVEERARKRARWQEDAVIRSRAGRAVSRLRYTSRQVTELQRRRLRGRPR